MKLITVYARKEPTTDSATLDARRCGAISKTPRFDVQVYCDRKARQPFGRFPWHFSNIPTRRNKTVMLNCYRWQLKWLKPLKP